MTKKKDKSSDEPIKGFDAVAWTRARRDELHRKYAHLSTREFVRRLSEEGEASEFGKKLAEKFGKVPRPEELLGSRKKTS